jgi:2',3'-cyclic-nucleotide 2'-phosphodiesterase/3'-nucleotidase
MTDFHGALAAGGTERTSGRPWGGALALATRIRGERAGGNARSILLDAGDQMQGTPESNFTAGRAAVWVLNALGVDAAALGNHEFDWGIDTLRARMRDMRYPMLAANVFERDSGARPAWLQPTAMLVRDGVRIGVIGYVTPDTPRVTMPLHVAALRFSAPSHSVVEEAQALRRQGADVVVVVAHLGGDPTPGGGVDGEIATLARAGSGHIDAIVGGHTHNFVAATVAGVPCVIAGASGRAVGRIVLDWDGERVRGAQVDVLRAFADSLVVVPGDAIATLVDSMRAAVRPYASRVLGRAARPLARTALANFVADAMREATGADVAITNPGGIRRDFAAGPITAGDVFELLPFENALVDVELSGAQLRAVIASRPEKCRVSGLTGRWDPEAPAGARLTLQHSDGTPVRDDRIYRVVTNSFVATGGDGFVGWEAGRVRPRDTTVRDAVSAAIERLAAAGRDVDPDPGLRFVVPVGD